MIDKEKYKIFFLFLIFAFSFSTLNCGDDVLEEVDSFKPNREPVIKSVEIEDSDGNNFAPGSYLLPGMLFYLTVEIEEYEGEHVEINYSAYIPGSEDNGSFNNKLTSTQNNSITSKVSYALPDILPLSQSVSLTIDVEDIKGADSSKKIQLGLVKPAPLFTSDSFENNTGTSIFTVMWQADSDCSYQYYLIDFADPDKECNIDLAASPKFYKYLEGETRATITGYDGSNEFLCIIIFDSLDQFDFLKYPLH